MNADELIESYVRDVVAQLPGKQRDDVALELRARLKEQLRARAKAAGRSADETMAAELLRESGAPDVVAAAYQPTLTIIDPADGRRFLRATMVGMAIIWAAGLLTQLRQPIGSTSDFLMALGRWWGGTVILSLWWPGLLVVAFGIASWARRRSSRTSEWRPAGNRFDASGVGQVMGLVGILFGLAMLIDPLWLLDAISGGHLAPEARAALTYTDAFRRHQAPILVALIVLTVPMTVTMILSGRRSVIMRRIEAAMSLAFFAVLVWTILGGPVFVGPTGDRALKGFLVVIAAVAMVDLVNKLSRGLRPAPSAKR
jgi:hypothetical protein